MTLDQEKTAPKISNMSRRSALKALGLGGGLVLSIPVVSKKTAAEMILADGAEETVAFEPNVYFSVRSDGKITVMIHRVEMGQGSRTGLAQILAEELCVDWDTVDFVQAPGHPKYGDQNTDGSKSIRNFYYPLRRGAAAARLMLERAAARKWGVNLSEVWAENSHIHGPADKKVHYTDLVEDAKSEKAPDASAIKLKPRSAFNHIRKGRKILDMDEILHGKPLFSTDILLDGMVFAVIARPPVVGSHPESYDEAAALKVAGVTKVIRMPDQAFPAAFAPLGGVAVVATNTWAAIKGREALNIKWAASPQDDYDSVSYEKGLWDSVSKPGTVHRKRGDVDAGLKAAAQVIESDYYVPHQSHAHMEPPTAVAEWKGDKVTVWASAQTPQRSRELVAGICKVPKENVVAHSPRLGAGFGRKSKPDFAVEAALLAREVGKPLKVIWTREDCMRHGFYHTVSAQKVTVGLDESGKVTTWRHRAAYPSISGSFNPAADGPSGSELGMGLIDMPFDLKNIGIEGGAAKAKARIGWMRSVNNIHQIFAVGSMVGEIAAATGKDQLTAWNELIGPDRIFDVVKEDGAQFGNYGNPVEDYPFDTKRLKAVLAKVAEMSGHDRKMPAGQGIGLAVARSFNSYVACAAEVEVDGSFVKVKRAWLAIDCGIAVNPDQIKAQSEGAVIFGMSYFMHSAITFENGAVVQGNYDDNPICRIEETPEVATYIVDNEHPPGGVGEPGLPPVAPAIGNAIFAATGKRIRRLPIGDQLDA